MEWAKAAEPTQMSLADTVSWTLIYKLIGWGFDRTSINLAAMVVDLFEKPRSNLDQANAYDEYGYSKESEVGGRRKPISQLNVKFETKVNVPSLPALSSGPCGHRLPFRAHSIPPSIFQGHRYDWGK